MDPYDDPAVSAGEIADYLHTLTPHPMDRHPDDTDADLPPQPPLTPCPWCGTTPILQPALRHGYFVSCDEPHCPVSPETTFDAETIEQAAERWNNRAIPQAA